MIYPFRLFLEKSASLRFVSLLAVLLAWPAAGAQAGAGLAGKVSGILGRYAQNPADWGIQVRSLETGKDLLHTNAGKLYMPASNLKLLVTAAALDGLGSEFRYRTTVLAAGRLERSTGVLHGDLVVVGSGDPTISDRFYADLNTVWDSLALAVSQAGITRVEGSLVADNRLFEPPYLSEGWGWEDLMWWYAAPVSALSFNDNCIDVEVFPSRRVGEAPEMRIRPQGSSVRFSNRAQTVASRAESRLVISRQTPGGEVSLGGGIYSGSLGYLEHVAVDDPARFAANAFADALSRAGIRLDGEVRVVGPGSPDSSWLDRSPAIVAQHVSVPLKDIVKIINKHSHNFYAEQLLFTLGARLGAGGSFEKGVEVEKRFLGRIGVDTRQLRIQDGSGLSRLNLVSTEMFVRLLAHLDGHRERETFIASLPVGGKDNGVQLLRNTAAEGKLFAKTGYISNVMALSGYTSTADGERVVFSILGNNWLIPRERARRLIRDVCVAVAESRRERKIAEEEVKP